MQKLQKIELNNYRALYGKHCIDLSDKCKNLMIYGENGSGKSSICLALNDFINTTNSPFVLANYENRFVTTTKRNSGYIQLSFRDTSKPKKHPLQKLELSLASSSIPTTGDFLKETQKLKGFLDYRSLLKTHFLKAEKVDLFELLLKELLFFYEDITGQTIGAQWKSFEDRLKVLVDADKENLIADLKILSTNLRLVLTDVERKAQDIIDYFEYSVKLHLELDDDITIEDGKFKDNFIFLRIDFHTLNRLTNHTGFLNEARLTAIASAIFLGGILSIPQTDIKCKLLILDDIFIGLDTANRMPFMKILNDKFIANDYQIIMTTYDKQWYELVKLYDQGKWIFAEMYAKKHHQNGFEIPILKSETDFISISNDYFNEGDFKASAAYMRTEFEMVCQKFCDKHKLKVKYQIKTHHISGEDYWAAVKVDSSHFLPRAKAKRNRIINNIEKLRTLVMNPFVHYDIHRPQFRTELRFAIKTVKDLKAALS
jgi:energy-coupling factor transporter ATP-binding protein EcfA2